MKKVLYHITEKENVPSILEKGLLCGGLSHRGSFVSLCEEWISWYEDGLAILEVDIDGIDCDIRTWLPQLDEVCVWGDIEPWRIRIFKKDEKDGK